MPTPNREGNVYLQDIWSDIEACDTTKTSEHLRHLIQRRIAALLLYARGLCQKKEVHEKLSVIESLAAAHIGEIGDPHHPEVLIDQWTVDSAEDDPQLLSALTALEDALGRSGGTTKHRLRDLVAEHTDAAA